MATSDLVLGLDKSATEQTTRFSSSNEAVLSNEMDIKSHVHDIKDLDEAATEDNICALLTQQIDGLVQGITDDTIKSMRKF